VSGRIVAALPSPVIVTPRLAAICMRGTSPLRGAVSRCHEVGTRSFSEFDANQAVKRL
jgi:hypothetical protein